MGHAAINIDSDFRSALFFNHDGFNTLVELTDEFNLEYVLQKFEYGLKQITIYLNNSDMCRSFKSIVLGDSDIDIEKIIFFSIDKDGYERR